jgi:hypothetical protein
MKGMTIRNIDRIKAPETLGFSKGYLDLAELDFPGGLLFKITFGDEHCRYTGFMCCR